MIGLDTNVLVRYLTQDDPTQARKATEVIETAAEQGEFLYITAIVICELVWVLEDAYGYGDDAVQTILERILRTAQFRFENKDLLWQALYDYRGGRANFSDYLIGRLGTYGGCQDTVTFDKALKGTPRFRLL